MGIDARKALLCSWLTCAVLALAPATAFAYPNYGANIPNGRFDTGQPGSTANTRCWLCHNSAYGGYGADCSGTSCLNSFGLDFAASGNNWTNTLAATDSDNDGWSNGQELRSNWGSTSTLSTSYTLPGNPSINCNAIPTSPADANTLRSRCISHFSSANYSSFATTNRLEPRETSFNVCASNTSDCDSNASCSRSTTNGRGDWSCTCDAGYTGTGHRRTYSHDFVTPNSNTGDDRLYVIRTSLVTGCTDINECAGNPCGGNGSCSQTTPGSSPGYTCSCNAGYRFNGSSCVVSNECTLTPSICGVGTCNELPPPSSYSCNCPMGYQFNGTTCVTENACVAGIDNCNRNATCTPVGTSRWTCACNSGYSGDGVTCNNINECRDPDICGTDGRGNPTGRCTDTQGSYDCACNSGYAFGRGECRDINECSMRPGPCGVGGASWVGGGLRAGCPLLA